MGTLAGVVFSHLPVKGQLQIQVRVASHRRVGEESEDGDSDWVSFPRPPDAMPELHVMAAAGDDGHDLPVGGGDAGVAAGEEDE